MICKRCKGSGHDKASRPEIRWESYVDDEGRHRKRHVTEKQGSGCMQCLGRGKHD